MSVINDSQPGDELICIAQFSGPPQGVKRSPETSRTFQIGEKVRYVGFCRNENLKDNPVCWQVIFDAADGKRYAATQTLFVTEACWLGIKKHFAKRLLREPKRRPNPKLRVRGGRK